MMNLKLTFFTALILSQCYTHSVMALRNSDVVSPENHHSKIELYEFGGLTVLKNAAIFYDSKANFVTLSCTLGSADLKIKIIEVEQFKYQYLRMSDCHEKLGEAVRSMIVDPLSFKLGIVLDYEDKKNHIKYYKFNMISFDDQTEKNNFINNKVRVVLKSLNPN